MEVELLLRFSDCFPPVREELIDFRDWCGRQPGQSIFEIFEWIDLESPASLNERHPNGCGMAAADRACKEKVLSPEDRWPQAIFRSIVMRGDEACFSVATKRLPLIDCICEGFAESRLRQDARRVLVDPGSELSEHRLRLSMPERFALLLGKAGGNLLDFKYTLEDCQSEVGEFRVLLLRIFEVAKEMGEATGSGGTRVNDTIVDGSTVGLENTGESFEHSFRMLAGTTFSKVVDVIRSTFVSAIEPFISLMRFTKPFFDDRHCRVVRLNDAGFQHELMHPFHDNLKQIACLFEPAAHGRARDGKGLSAKDTLLPIERKMPVELGDGDVSNQAGRGVAFVDGLIRLGGGDNFSLTARARVSVFDVLDQFECSFDDVELLGCSETDDLARLPATWAGKLFGLRDFMLIPSTIGCVIWNVSAAPTVLFLFWNDSEVGTLGVEIALVVVVYGLAGACERGSGDFGRAFAEDLAIAPANLFFEFGNALREEAYSLSDGSKTFELRTHFLNEFVAFGYSFGEEVIIVQLRIGHCFSARTGNNYILQ